MAIDKHPSRDATKPVVKGPDTRTTSGKGTKVTHGSGQAGTSYGARHELQAKDPNRSEMRHHFEDYTDGGSKAMKDGGEPGPGRQSTSPARTFGKIKES